MGKAKKVTFKKLATKVSKGLDIASKAAKPAAYVAKYQNEIMAAGKFIKKHSGGGDPEQTMKTLKKVGKGVYQAGKFVADNKETIGKVAKEGIKKGLKDPRIQKAILDQSLGLGLKYGEKYADKKLGKYKAYRIAKGGVNLLYDVGTGNVGGALNEATNIYGEADPNKKRVAKVKGAVGGINQMVSSAMAGDYEGAYGGALQTYAVADPNKKRVQKVLDINNKYVVPAYNLYNSASNFYDQASGAAAISDRSKIDDMKVNIKSQKLNSAKVGSNIGEHKANVIAAHDNQDYGALAKHAKLLHTEAKSANRMMKADPIGGGGKRPGLANISNPYGIVAGEPGQGRPMVQVPMQQAPIGGSSMKPISTMVPIGGGSTKPR